MRKTNLICLILLFLIILIIYLLFSKKKKIIHLENFAQCKNIEKRTCNFNDVSTLVPGNKLQISSGGANLRLDKLPVPVDFKKIADEVKSEITDNTLSSQQKNALRVLCFIMIKLIITDKLGRDGGWEARQWQANQSWGNAYLGGDKGKYGTSGFFKEEMMKVIPYYDPMGKTNKKLFESSPKNSDKTFNSWYGGISIRSGLPIYYPTFKELVDYMNHGNTKSFQKIFSDLGETEYVNRFKDLIDGKKLKNFDYEDLLYELNDPKSKPEYTISNLRNLPNLNLEDNLDAEGMKDFVENVQYEMNSLYGSIETILFYKVTGKRRSSNKKQQIVINVIGTQLQGLNEDEDEEILTEEILGAPIFVRPQSSVGNKNDIFFSYITELSVWNGQRENIKTAYHGEFFKNKPTWTHVISTSDKLSKSQDTTCDVFIVRHTVKRQERMCGTNFDNIYSNGTNRRGEKYKHNLGDSKGGVKDNNYINVVNEINKCGLHGICIDEGEIKKTNMIDKCCYGFEIEDFDNTSNLTLGKGNNKWSFTNLYDSDQILRLLAKDENLTNIGTCVREFDLYGREINPDLSVLIIGHGQDKADENNKNFILVKNIEIDESLIDCWSVIHGTALRHFDAKNKKWIRVDHYSSFNDKYSNTGKKTSNNLKANIIYKRSFLNQYVPYVMELIDYNFLKFGATYYFNVLAGVRASVEGQKLRHEIIYYNKTTKQAGGFTEDEIDNQNGGSFENGGFGELKGWRMDHSSFYKDSRWFIMNKSTLDDNNNLRVSPKYSTIHARTYMNKKNQLTGNFKYLQNSVNKDNSIPLVNFNFRREGFKNKNKISGEIIKSCEQGIFPLETCNEFATRCSNELNKRNYCYINENYRSLKNLLLLNFFFEDQYPASDKDGKKLPNDVGCDILADTFGDDLKTANCYELGNTPITLYRRNLKDNTCKLEPGASRLGSYFDQLNRFEKVKSDEARRIFESLGATKRIVGSGYKLDSSDSSLASEYFIKRPDTKGWNNNINKDEDFIGRNKTGWSYKTMRGKNNLYCPGYKISDCGGGVINTSVDNIYCNQK